MMVCRLRTCLPRQSPLYLSLVSVSRGRVMSISHITDNLFLTWSASPESSLSSTVDPSKDVLRSFVLSLSPPFSPNRTRDTIKYLQELKDDNKPVGEFVSRSMDGEEQALEDAVLSRLVAAIYAEALNTLLSEAISAEVEAQWWADLERSWLRIAYHLVQSTLSSDIPLFVVHPCDCASSFAPPHFQSLQRCASRTAL